MEPVSHDNAGSRRMRCGGDPARSAEAGRLVCPMGDSGAVGGPGGRRAPTSTEVRHVNVPFSHPSGGRGQKDGRKVRSRGELPLTLAHDARSSSPRRGEPSSRTSGCGRTACASPAGGGHRRTRRLENPGARRRLHGGSWGRTLRKSQGSSASTHSGGQPSTPGRVHSSGEACGFSAGFSPPVGRPVEKNITVFPQVCAQLWMNHIVVLPQIHRLEQTCG